MVLVVISTGQELPKGDALNVSFWQSDVEDAAIELAKIGPGVVRTCCPEAEYRIKMVFRKREFRVPSIGYHD
jgi:hypothetical protein